jgi:hypothetical protein
MELHERYRQNALGYCVAASKLDAEETNDFIAPISLCLAFAIELYLKCVLLKSGKTAEELSRKPFGHDTWSMWGMAELRSQREQAELYAESCYQRLVGEGPSNRQIPVPGTVSKHLEDLSRLHGSPSRMALRYPTERTPVPDAALMLCVFESLIRAEELGDKIERAN